MTKNQNLNSFFLCAVHNLQYLELIESFSILGVLFNEGPAWKEPRRFALMSLRDFGMGKLSLEGRIQEETSIFIEELNKLNGKPTDLQVLMTNVISNVICSIVFGRRFEYDDQEYNQIIKNLNAFFRASTKASLADNIPILKYLPTNMKYQVQNRINKVNPIMPNL